jgi:predicted transcriptional regulator of viral defense system
MHKASGRRARISTVLRQADPFVTVDAAAAVLRTDRTRAAKLLSDWVRQGWVKRVRRGLYAPVPLDAAAERFVLEDAWVLVPHLFEPGYIGGWTAAEHWDLTEQIFRSVCVFTTRPARHKRPTIFGVPFVIKHVAEDMIFGTRPVWRDQVKIAVSDPTRTLVDMLDDPSVGGGIAHVDECLRRYLVSPDTQTRLLIEYADRLGNGAVFKRLGFLVSKESGFERVAEACYARLTAGNAKLDPALPAQRLVKRWRLWVPSRWKAQATHG